MQLTLLLLYLQLISRCYHTLDLNHLFQYIFNTLIIYIQKLNTFYLTSTKSNMLPGRIKRLINEIQHVKNQIQNKQLQSIEILELEEFNYAIFLCSGPIDSPYQGFWFRIKVQWSPQHPFYPPKCTLLDKIWNPYVDYETNQICIDILRVKQGYSPAMKTTDILISIFSLLAESKISETNDGFVNPQAAIQMMKNYPYFCEHARKLCEISSYKSQQIYSNQMRGIPQQHTIEIESHQLSILIAESLESKKFNKKPKEQNTKLEINESANPQVPEDKVASNPNSPIQSVWNNQNQNHQIQQTQSNHQQLHLSNPEIISFNSINEPNNVPNPSPETIPEQSFQQLVELHRTKVKQQIKLKKNLIKKGETIP